MGIYSLSVLIYVRLLVHVYVRLLAHVYLCLSGDSSKLLDTRSYLGRNTESV